MSGATWASVADLLCRARATRPVPAPGKSISVIALMTWSPTSFTGSGSQPSTGPPSTDWRIGADRASADRGRAQSVACIVMRRNLNGQFGPPVPRVVGRSNSNPSLAGSIASIQLASNAQKIAVRCSAPFAFSTSW
jgi:hypothetical protein